MNTVATVDFPPRSVPATDKQSTAGWDRRRGAGSAVGRIAYGRGIHDDDCQRLLAAQHLSHAKPSGAGRERTECQQQDSLPLRT